MKDFNDKVCVLTGAGSGIGRALALDLAGRGARLALSDINSASAAATATACTLAGARAAESYELDVSDRAAVLAHADEVSRHFGQVNLVINNAGVAMHANVVEMTIEDMEWILGINFWGVVYGTKAFLPHLIESGDGHVVNISSLFGLIAVPGQAAYNATKFAVRGFTEALRQEMLVAGHPVGVSCVHPGGIKTAIARSARMPNGNGQELADRFDKLARTSPERAASTILRGVERERPRILVGADATVLDLLQRAVGARYQGLVYRGTKRVANV
jgi:NAD(P)-dependent dehydrogenase (short-subunit alcohol dehydrogenase family)